MKKLFLAGLLSVLAVSANADSWRYNLSTDDFDGDTRSASINPDDSGIELIIIKNSTSESTRKPTVVFTLPRGILNSSSCKPCTARVIADGKEVEPIRLLAASNFRNYYLHRGEDYFFDLFQNNKVVKIQLPTHQGSQTLTFTQSKPFSLQELDSAK